ncbi:hypothetical protein [Geobacter benzoatilyticus]|uniref:Uncharacterized protein n=1 Tax=Geobacter benzoatilyticus TaxID=2815309 RepID=A0ABX7Q1P8_9BACT|nr:hypothetical protein [Geobacter benzoatilyticus]QSV45324.1 hypothetical protein JZM60_14525 [Geobacter benzoatilyticus]
MALPSGWLTPVARVDGRGRKPTPTDSACVVPFRVADGNGPILGLKALNFRLHLIVVLHFEHSRRPYPFLSRQ